MGFPSANVCVGSEAATALNGAPVTTLPPCLPPKPSSALGPPNGPTLMSPLGAPPVITPASEGVGGAVSCPFANPTLNTKTPPNTALIHILRFIIPSPLLSRTVAKSLLSQSRQALPSTARSILRLASLVPSLLLYPPVSTSPKRLLPPSACSSPRRRASAPLPLNIYCGSRTACGNPSSPTSKSTWIHSLARSSLTGKPSAPSAPRCRRTRRIAASSVSVTKAPGSNVKPLSSLPATSASELAAPLEPGCGIPIGSLAAVSCFAPSSQLLSWKLFAAGTEFR